MSIFSGVSFGTAEGEWLNGINPQQSLADVLDRIGKGHAINRIDGTGSPPVDRR
jgi:hypothetical protein